MSELQPSFLSRFFGAIWNGINSTRRFVLNLIFVGFLFFFISALFSDDDSIVINDSTALVLNLRGDIVEQKVAVDPMEAIINDAVGSNDKIPEVLLTDVINVIGEAKVDSKIKALVLDLGMLRSGGLNKYDEIGAAIEDFKSSGKPVVAIGDYYTQNQYYLASYADKILMNPQGWVSIEGFGAYGMYFRSALEKLKVTPHVFRVGTFKSAVEPFIRDDMSDAAKEANNAWLSDLWSQYATAVGERRGIDQSQFNWDLDTYLAEFNKTSGDQGLFALNSGWVDKLSTREETRNYLIDLVGTDSENKSFSQIGYDDYLTAVSQPAFPTSTDKVAIVVAKGNIMNGKQPEGTIGGDSTAALLRKARFDSSVKAVVLRIDSPGGSAFASEIIRQEIESLKAAGKPVVASMSTYAASGGYWIAAPANEIWAAPSTITGSIGIFGMFATFERSLDAIGIHSDGVGTSDIAGYSPTRPLPKKMGDVIQLTIENGYKQFIELVAEERSMNVEDVDKIAQGRVWTGSAAMELGLVDKLGSYNDAIASAASIAGLDRYDTQVITRDLSSKELLLQEIFGVAQAWLPETEQATVAQQPVVQMIDTLMKDLSILTQFNDPMGAYAFCLPCNVE